MSQIVVSAMYRFVRLENYVNMQKPILDFMLQNHIRGSLLLAHEGINGTVAGTREAIDALYAFLATFEGLSKINAKESLHDTYPFNRSRVKLKKEIVTLGVSGIDPNHVVGTYVKPKEWNALISRDDVTLVDTRNDYEVEIGRFKHAINPNTKTFREFPEYTRQALNPKEHKKVAMYCTGGIRCEKSTAYLKSLGFEEVYHLEGGILKYLEEVPPEESMWEGECFVFDERVAVDHHLNKGSYDQCHACRYPISAEDKHSDKYQPGISCPRCYERHNEAQKQRFAERERQNALAKARGEVHIGQEARLVAQKRHALKKERRTQSA